MNSVDISVIIPAYRAERSIRECLDSVLAQNISNIEIICVDDGSDDKTPEILDEYAQKDSRIILLSQKNMYAGVARNRGIEIARGEYVTFLDADDFYLPDALEKMLSIAKKHNLDFVKAGFSYLDTQSSERYRTLYSMNSAIGALDRGRVLNFAKKPLRLLNIADVPWNAVYKRSFLEKNAIRFNNLQCVNDHSFYIHCLLCAERIMVFDFPVVCYRVSQAESLTGDKANRFENQIASYYIVRALVKEADAKVKNMIMERELYSAFDWYTRLSATASTPAMLDEKMRGFIGDFDESDVSSGFTANFAYSEIYNSIKHGAYSPNKKNKIKKVLNCYREHGMKYTLARIFKRERRYKE